MREDQSTYAESVKKLGLERGIEGSRATHQTVQHYYESINRGTRSQVSISPEGAGAACIAEGHFHQRRGRSGCHSQTSKPRSER